LESELGHIQTFWTVVRQAHGSPAEAVTLAQQRLLERYGKAVKRYLLGALHDPEAAEELTQEFALRFLRGSLRGADPQRGRFRDFVKGVLGHLIADYHRRRHRQARLLADAGAALAAPTPAPDDPDHLFTDSWRDELLDRSWKALQRHQEHTGQPFFTVLHFRAEHPELHSNPMAEQLGAVLGKPVNAAWVRQTLHRSRKKFAQLLVTEVLQTLETPTADQLREELGALGLLEYCRPVLDVLDSSH
jgi:RNA polymerase sigma-70 factor (ECF subfamily)